MLKEKVQRMLTAAAMVANKLGLTPNMLSAFGVLFAFLSALAYVEWRTARLYLILAAILLLLSGFCDTLDGALSRLHNKATAFGGFLDSLLDRYADAVVYIGIILGGLCDFLWGLIALSGSMLVSYSRARAEAAGIKMESIGLAERAERIIILTVTTLIGFFWQPEAAMEIGIILLAVLTNATVLQRSLYAYKKLRK
ncbi:MAG: archaetidylinositol phosphate synthase [Candidatus Bathyarchaeia archaeon]